ncbi:MAG: hypothetical protein EOP04_09155, partial [Proteobacteria bacterium]
MTFEGFFQYAPIASILCGVLATLLVAISPMGRYLKAGILVLLLPLFFANYVDFVGATTAVLQEVVTAFNRPGLSKGGSLAIGYVKWIGVILSNKDFYIPVVLSVATGLGFYQLARSICRRFFLNSPWIQVTIEVGSGALALYITHGLILLPLLLIMIISWSRDSQINEKVLSGKAAIREMYSGLLVAQLRFLVHPKNGIYVHPLLRIPRSYEDRGFIVIGAPGSGKTYTIMTHFLPQFRKRRDRIVAFDYKGDFTQIMGEDDDVLIVSPLDARSVIWDIAKDIDTEAKAWEFASLVVQRGDSGADAVFEDWAKDLLTACLIQLQVEQKQSWGFRGFYKNSQNLDQLIDAVKKYRPECQFAANFTGESKQFEAIKGTIRRAMVRLEPLSRAWGDLSKPERLLSLNEWINAPSVLKTTLLIRYDPRYEETIGPWVSNFINQVILTVLGRPDAKGKLKNFRLWLMIDEAQQLPFIPKLFEAGRAGRSKGLRLFIGTQDCGKFDSLYKADGGRESLLNLIGFKIIGHLGSEGMQNFAAGLLSKNHIEVRKRNPQPGKGGSSYSIEHRYEPAIAPGEFGAIPVPTSYNGSLFWLVHQGWNPVLLRFITPFVRDKYEAQVDAKWLSDMDRSWNQIPGDETQNSDVIAPSAPSENSTETDQKSGELSVDSSSATAGTKLNKSGKNGGSSRIGIASNLTENE